MLFVHAGGLGDQVLFSGALAALRAARPNLRISVLVRAGLAGAVRAMSPWLSDVPAVDFDPYSVAIAEPETYALIERARAALAGRRYDLVVSAELRPTWLSWFVAAETGAAALLTLHRSLPSLQLLHFIRDDFGLRYPPIRRYASAAPGVHERERYRALLGAFGASGEPDPAWQIPASATSAAARAAGLEAVRYVACFPGGAASVPYKCWPAADFAATLAEAYARFGLVPAIIGLYSEAAALDAVAEAARALGLEPIVVYDRGDDFERTRATIAAAAAYVGNDTGLVHVAQACGVPGVTIFGGGTYPAYLPWGPGSVGVVNPLPCFGCHWDCAFDRGLCVEAIAASDAIAALERALAAPKAAPPALLEVEHVDAGRVELIALASRRFAAAQADRAARLEAVQRMRRSRRTMMLRSQLQIERARAEMEKIHAAANERLARNLELRGAIANIREQLEAAAAENERLRAAAQERADAIARAAEAERMLGLEVQRLYRDVVELQTRRTEDVAPSLAATLVRDESADAHAGADVAELQRVADERLRALTAVDRELSAVRTEAVRRAEIIAEMTDLLDAQEREIERLRSRGS